MGFLALDTLGHEHKLSSHLHRINVKLEQRPPPPWPALPQDILRQIFARLTDDLDILRCRHVCASWRPVATELYLKFVPLLLILNRADPSLHHTLLNITTMETRSIHLPETDGHWICSATNGWLLTVSLNNPSTIHLLNPISRIRILLPPLNSSLPAQRLVKRCIISASPLEKRCVVLVIYNDVYSQLACCKPGDQQWTFFEDFGLNFVDIIFYKAQFYAVDEYGKILCSKPGSSNPKLTMIKPTLDRHGRKYLVQSLSSDLFLVCRKWDYVENDDDDPCFITAGFEVYRLDLRTDEWRRVKNLGGQALIVGLDGSNKSVSANSCGVGLRENCIYFTRNTFQSIAEDFIDFGFQNLSVYDFVSRRTQQLWESELCSSQFH